MSVNKNLLIRPDFAKPCFLNVTPQSAGWDYLNFSAIRLGQGETWHKQNKEEELALVILSGSAKIATEDQIWPIVGSRKDVFSGMPTTLYLSRNKSVEITALSSNLEFGVGWTQAFSDHPTRLILPQEVY